MTGYLCSEAGWLVDINTLRPKQDCRHFADDIFKCIFLNENAWILFKISLNFVFKIGINNITALVQIMAWCRPGDKPLSGAMTVRLSTHICVTWPQLVKDIVFIQMKLQNARFIITLTLSHCKTACPVYTGMTLKCHWLTQCTLEHQWNKNLVETVPHWNTTGKNLFTVPYTETPLEKNSSNCPTLACHWRITDYCSLHWNTTEGT